MTDFWWGVLALPALVVGVTVVAYLVVAAWLGLSKASEHRTARIIRDDGLRKDRYRDTMYSSQIAARVAFSISGRAWWLGPGCNVILFRWDRKADKRNIENASFDIDRVIDRYRGDR